MRNSNFLYACRGSSFIRQFFLDSFYDTSKTLQEVSGGIHYWKDLQEIVNCPNTSGVNSSTRVQSESEKSIGFALAATANPTSELYKNMKPRIYVFPAAFDLKFHKHLGELISTIVDHEGQHARDHTFPAQRPFNLRPNGEITQKGIAEMELRAYDNQIKNFDKRRCSEEYRRILLSQRENILRHL